VAAAALEQSMLESKDKDTLLEMAKALGVKVTARQKKSDIIDKILDLTGSNTPAAVAAPSGNSQSTQAAPAGDIAAERPELRSAAPKGSAPANESKDESPSSDAEDSPAEVVIGPDGEPLADWEIELASNGGDTNSGASDDRSAPGNGRSRATAPRNDRNRNEQHRGDQKNGDQKNGDQKNGENGDRAEQGGQSDRNRNPQGGGQQGGGQQGGGQQGGGQQGGGQQGGGEQGGGQRTDNRNDRSNESGDANKRRRRRRKGRGGQDGPQGEDVELIEQEPGFESSEPVDTEGYLDIRDEGYGFLRVNGYLPSKDDAYIPLKLARQFGLRKGDHITGKVRPAGRNEKNPGLLEIYTINGGDPEAAKKRPHFESLTALFPDKRLTLEDPNDPSNMTARIIDLVSPIGKGQRGIIVSPPKAGKTTVMKTIAKSIELNNPEVVLLVLLIDERPEEVTDMRRSVKGEVISSTFDRPSDEHTHVAEMTIAKARRMVEAGKDVVIILDGITRLSRAYNLAAPASGKILSGGIDAGALYPPKKFFGSARNCEEGGSLTILATALVDTNSRMDDAIFEEFKGTGNMELRLDRKVAERRIYPAIDVDASSTRHEELLFDRKQLQQVWKLRRVLSGLAQDGSAAAGLELLIDRLKTFRTNDEFLAEIAKQP